MDETRLTQARQLASRPYRIRVFPDESADGEPCFVASVPELPVCMSDGDTVEEALRNIESAKADYIYFLLKDGLPVPEPLGPDVRIETRDYAANAKMNCLEFASAMPTPEPVS